MSNFPYMVVLFSKQGKNFLILLFIAYMPCYNGKQAEIEALRSTFMRLVSPISTTCTPSLKKYNFNE
jgi:hypothetical protein